MFRPELPPVFIKIKCCGYLSESTQQGDSDTNTSQVHNVNEFKKNQLICVTFRFSRIGQIGFGYFSLFESVIILLPEDIRKTSLHAKMQEWLVHVYKQGLLDLEKNIFVRFLDIATVKYLILKVNVNSNFIVILSHFTTIFRRRYDFRCMIKIEFLRTYLRKSCMQVF